MGQIQQGINQLFTTAGFMARLSPEVEKLGEKHKLKKQEKGFAAAGQHAAEAAKAAFAKATLEPDQKEQLKLVEESHRDLTEAMGMANKKESTAKDLFELDPSKESYDRYKALRDGNIEINETFAQMQENLARLREKGLAKIEQRAQRRNFMKALGSEQVNFGSGAEGTVSDLPKNMQKAIASSFSKAERKELMDKYYGSK